MSSCWTPERRAAAAARIRLHQPWLQSTGPRSTLGKARSSRNAFKNASSTRMRRLQRELNQCLRDLRAMTAQR